MSQALSLLVVGYGNSLRRDDGAGLLLSARLAETWQNVRIPVQLVQTHQLTPDLAETMADPAISHVLFVDARVAEQDEATVVIEAVKASEADQQSIGHQMGPSMLQMYAEKLFGRTPRTVVITVPGVDFGFGEELSEGVQQILGETEAIAQQVLAFIDSRD